MKYNCKRVKNKDYKSTTTFISICYWVGRMKNTNRNICNRNPQPIKFTVTTITRVIEVY